MYKKFNLKLNILNNLIYILFKMIFNSNNQKSIIAPTDKSLTNLLSESINSKPHFYEKIKTIYPNKTYFTIERNSIGSSEKLSKYMKNYSTFQKIVNKQFQKKKINDESLLNTKIEDSKNNNYSMNLNKANNNSILINKRFLTPTNANSKYKPRIINDIEDKLLREKNSILIDLNLDQIPDSLSLSNTFVDNVNTKKTLIQNLKRHTKEEQLFRKDFSMGNFDNLKIPNFLGPKVNTQFTLRDIDHSYNNINNKSNEKLINSFEVSNEEKLVKSKINDNNVRNLINDNNQLKNISEIENSLDHFISLSKNENLNENNKSLTNVKHYKGYKKFFKEIIKNYHSNHGAVFDKILQGFEDVINNLIAECKLSKEKSENYEILLNKYSNLNKKYSDTTKIINEKNYEIEKLKKNIELLEKKLCFNHSRNEDDISENDYTDACSTPKENDHNKIIHSINKKVLEDLDALYFYDKIKMKSTSITPTQIPKLNFNFTSESSKKTDKKQIQIQHVNKCNNLEQEKLKFVPSNKNNQLKLYFSNKKNTLGIGNELGCSIKNSILNNNIVNINGINHGSSYKFTDYLSMQKISNKSTKDTVQSHSKIIIK